MMLYILLMTTTRVFGSDRTVMAESKVIQTFTDYNACQIAVGNLYAGDTRWSGKTIDYHCTTVDVKE